MVNNEDIVINYKQQINVDLSDHNTMIIRMAIYPNKMVKRKPLKEYYNTNLHRIDMRRRGDNDPHWTKFEQLMNNDCWDMDKGYESDFESKERTKNGEMDDKVVFTMNDCLTRNIEQNAKEAFCLKK